MQDRRRKLVNNLSGLTEIEKDFWKRWKKEGSGVFEYQFGKKGSGCLTELHYLLAKSFMTAPDGRKVTKENSSGQKGRKGSGLWGSVYVMATRGNPADEFPESVTMAKDDVLVIMFDDWSIQKRKGAHSLCSLTVLAHCAQSHSLCSLCSVVL